MLRVVINTRHGGFGLSPEAILWLLDRRSLLIKATTFAEYGIEETADEIIAIAKNEKGEEGRFAHVKDLLYSFWYGSSLLDVSTCTVYTADILDVIDQEDWAKQTVMVRTHPDLIAVVEALGVAANGQFSKLKIVEIEDPDMTLDNIQITGYEGAEWIEELHRTWR